MRLNPFHKTLRSIEATQEFAIQCAQLCPPGSLVYLSGDLGVGKTTFARYFIRSYGYEGIVRSPSYALVESYPVTHPILKDIHHFDFYRFQSADELETLGLADYHDPHSICLIEWPEKAHPFLPEPTLHLVFTDEKKRSVAITAEPQLHIKLSQLWPGL